MTFEGPIDSPNVIFCIDHKHHISCYKWSWTYWGFNLRQRSLIPRKLYIKQALVMLFPYIFLCCIRVDQLVINIFHTFFTNNILILFPNLLSCMKQDNITFITEYVIQGLSFGRKYNTFCNFLDFGIFFLNATIFPIFSVIFSFLLLHH